MSLDVYLTLPGVTDDRKHSGIFLREHGRIREISREEWDARFPGTEPVQVIQDATGCTVYSANITHNLNRMAGEAGIYKHLWRPDEIGITQAWQLVTPLREGLGTLESAPQRFHVFNPKNGWGDYHGLVRFVRDYLAACERYPTATVQVWR